MKIEDLFKKCVDEREAELKKLKAAGKKIVGISGYGHIPEELIYASGAIPQRLIRGGEFEPLEDALPYMTRYLDTFVRELIGYSVTGKEPIYKLCDLIVGEIVSIDMNRFNNCIEYFTDIPLKQIYVPHNPHHSNAVSYFMGRLNELKELIEKSTGEKVTDEKLNKYIKIYNEMRDLLKEISDLRKSPSPPISGLDFLKLNHCSFYCDIEKYVSSLRSVSEELKEAGGKYPEDAPRIALIGSPIVMGDYICPEMIEDAGGVIVIEELTGGHRHYDIKVKLDGNPMEDLVDRYLRGILPTAYTRPWGRRLPYFEKIVKDFKVDGVILYQLLYNLGTTYEAPFIEKKMKEMDIPYMVIGSEYDLERKREAIKTRIETFMEIVKRKKGE